MTKMYVVIPWLQQRSVFAVNSREIPNIPPPQPNPTERKKIHAIETHAENGKEREEKKMKTKNENPERKENGIK